MRTFGSVGRKYSHPVLKIGLKGADDRLSHSELLPIALRRIIRLQQPEAPVPLPYHPWRPPPLGSLGSQWDGRLEFPRDVANDRRAERDRVATEERQRREQLSRVQPGTLAIKRPWSAWAVASWVFLGCALTSIGPAAWLQPILAVLAGAAGGIAIHRVRTFAIFNRGVGPGLVAVFASTMILLHSILAALGIGITGIRVDVLGR